MNESTSVDTSAEPAGSGNPWACVTEALSMCQSPKPMGADWVESLPPEFEATAKAAIDRLLVAQNLGDDLPDSVWSQVLDSTRAGLLRNTLALCLRAYQNRVHEKRLGPRLARLMKRPRTK